MLPSAGEDVLDRPDQRFDRAAVALRDAEHPGHLAHGDLDADTRQEADQHAAGQEVGDEPELEQAGAEQEHAAHQRSQRGQRDVLGRIGGRHAGEADGEDRSGGRVRADHEVAGGPEQREEQDRQQEGVQARDHRRAGDLRVAHDLGDGQRGKRCARRHVHRDAARIEREDASQER